MQKRIETLAMVINTQKDMGLQTAADTLGVLRDCPVKVRLSDRFRGTALADTAENLCFCRDEELLDGADCVLVLGGDGSVIKAASSASVRRLPVLGINLGRVGYLAEVERGELSLLPALCRGEYRIERRMMLDVCVIRDGRTIHTMKPALNDAVISNGAISHMVDLSVSAGTGNGIRQFVANFHADGVIAATPTGSTAYSMSAGGPVIDPGLDCICLTPVCSHSLTARPMLLSPMSVLSIENICTREDNTYLTVDGGENFKLLQHDVVSIAKSEIETQMIRFRESSFYSLLNRKMSHSEF